MLPDVELVELPGSTGDADIDAPAETLRTPGALRRPILFIAALAAVVAGAAMGVVATSRGVAPAPSARSASAPAIASVSAQRLPPSAPAQVVTAVAADLGSVLLRSAACSATSFCVLLPDPASTVVPRLGPFATGTEVTGATMITAGDRVLGRGAEVTVVGGVVARLVVVRAGPGPSTMDVHTPRSAPPGAVSTSVRRGAWQLTATLTGPPGAALPLAAARDWVDNSALPA